MWQAPETKYAKSGDVSIAYQVMGEGQVDLVYSPGFISHLEFQLTNPDYVRYHRRLAEFARVIRFDKRGTGLSDRDCGIANIDQRMDDIRAVMDAAGSERAFLMGVSEGGPMSAVFTATYPQRVHGLILYGCYARTLKAPDYPWGADEEAFDAAVQHRRDNWGTTDLAYKSLKSWLSPSRADNPEYVEWFARLNRTAVSPSAAAALSQMNRGIDVRDVLRMIAVPTLVLSREGDQSISVEEISYLASLLPNAKQVVLPGRDHTDSGEGQEQLLAEIEQFVTGKRPAAIHDRVLATVMFTDIVDSTRLAASLGDRRWKEIRSDHDAISLRCIDQYRGRAIKQTGDGFLATFDGPLRAIECAKAIRKEASGIDLRIRAGLHTGEIEVLEGDVAGIAVNLAARVASLAAEDDVLVSRTVRDLVAGAPVTFEDIGSHELKGVSGEWQIYRVA